MNEEKVRVKFERVLEEPFREVVRMLKGNFSLRLEEAMVEGCVRIRRDSSGEYWFSLSLKNVPVDLPPSVKVYLHYYFGPEYYHVFQTEDFSLLGELPDACWFCGEDENGSSPFPAEAWIALIENKATISVGLS